jgi:cyclohexanecarboxyl-CoA dehydrogenase
MNPYLDADLIALSEQARRFATDRIAPGFHGAGDVGAVAHSDISHPSTMPTPELTEKQIDEIAAYIASLRRAK